MRFGCISSAYKWISVMYYVTRGLLYSVSGQGPSKKAAKHLAAEAALNILQIDAGTVWVDLKQSGHEINQRYNIHWGSFFLKKKMPHIHWFQLLKSEYLWDFLSSMIVKWIYLDNLRNLNVSTCFLGGNYDAIFWHFIDHAIYQVINIICLLIDNENNHQLQPCNKFVVC